MRQTLLASLCSATVLGLVGVPGALAKSPSNGLSSEAPSSLTYTVTKNDSLSGIARKTKVNLAGLLQVNNFVLSSLIMPGQIIKLPTSSTSIASSTSTTYTVVKNDSLSGIAQKAQVTLSSFLKINGFSKSSVIMPGQVVKLPVGHLFAAPASAPAPAPASVNPKVNARIQTVIDFAMAQIGKPYAFGTAGPLTYDCSGLVRASFATVKINLPHQSLLQSTYGTAVDWKTTPIQKGDLVFSFSSRTPQQIGHVGIAISSTQWIVAPYTGTTVSISRLPSIDKIQAVRRIL
ncbi:MAG: LysM peptidoglycan-binding domain-containing protein [Actinobacteria bacterium]|nr:LysM peptidoglycan-binding domain-containing protein [Actinomycetota bacterium]